MVLMALSGSSGAAAPTQVKAFFREGQTFLTWKEDNAATGESYRVYRHTAPITAANIAQAKRLADVPEGSSKFREMWKVDGSGTLKRQWDPTTEAELKRIIPRLVIQPVQAGQKPKMLAKDAGLFVWTVKEPAAAEFHYAVTTVAAGKEDTIIGQANTAGPIREVKQPIGAVKYHVELTGGKPHREWHILWMDYAAWNPHYMGYAVPFAITLEPFKPGGTCPSAHLDGIGTMNVLTADYTHYACADFALNAPNHATWYFGYGEKFQVGQDNRKGGFQFKDTIVNYTQHRILQTVLWARRRYKITEPKFVIQGNSMGASGAIGFALNYPKFVTAVYANQGLTDYRFVRRKAGGEPLWTPSIWGNYGHPEVNNPIRNLPFGNPRLDWNQKFNGMGVFDYRDAAKFLEKNVAEDFPLMLIGHTFQDGSIPFYSQGKHFEAYARRSRHCLVYTANDGDHSWQEITAESPMIQLVRWDESRPGFSNSPPIQVWRYNKFRKESRGYNNKVGWGVKEQPFKGKVVQETETSWTLPIYYAAQAGQEKEYACEITPRNLQKLKVRSGDTFTYQIKTIDGSKTDSSGTITADKHNLLLIPNVPIRRSGALIEVKLKARAGT